MFYTLVPIHGKPWNNGVATVDWWGKNPTVLQGKNPITREESCYEGRILLQHNLLLCYDKNIEQ